MLDLWKRDIMIPKGIAKFFIISFQTSKSDKSVCSTSWCSDCFLSSLQISDQERMMRGQKVKAESQG